MKRTHVALGTLALLGLYGLAYVAARATHRLVRYESGCVARGNLEGHARDYWIWPFRCSELRRYLEPDGWETAFSPLLSLEEALRPHEARWASPRPSVCELPPSTFPSQGFSRPAWCP